jgi:hypothetical protein
VKSVTDAIEIKNKRLEGRFNIINDEHTKLNQEVSRLDQALTRVKINGE